MIKKKKVKESLGTQPMMGLHLNFLEQILWNLKKIGSW